jgi:hypothetical protein
LKIAWTGEITDKINHLRATFPDYNPMGGHDAAAPRTPRRTVEKLCASSRLERRPPLWDRLQRAAERLKGVPLAFVPTRGKKKR